MTFTPTPPTNLPTPAQVYEDGVEMAQVAASLYAAQETFNTSVLASIADLYSRLPAGSEEESGIWEWSTSLPIGTGQVFIAVLGATNRSIEISRTDADGVLRSFAGLDIGDTVVLMDDPSSPPVTAFRQYVVSAVTLHPAWVHIEAARVAIFGSQDTPTPGTRLRLLLG